MAKTDAWRAWPEGMTWRQRLDWWRLRWLSLRDPIQRDWEFGDPARVARVKELAARIRAELDAGDAERN